MFICPHIQQVAEVNASSHIGSSMSRQKLDRSRDRTEQKHSRILVRMIEGVPQKARTREPWTRCLSVKLIYPPGKITVSMMYEFKSKPNKLEMLHSRSGLRLCQKLHSLAHTQTLPSSCQVLGHNSTVSRAPALQREMAGMAGSRKGCGSIYTAANQKN